MFRVKVMSVSPRGNPRDIVTLCKTAEERDAVIESFRKKYPEAEIMDEEIS